jgi:hypothetical protein
VYKDLTMQSLNGPGRNLWKHCYRSGTPLVPNRSTLTSGLKSLWRPLRAYETILESRYTTCNHLWLPPPLCMLARSRDLRRRPECSRARSHCFYFLALLSKIFSPTASPCRPLEGRNSVCRGSRGLMRHMICADCGARSRHAERGSARSRRG